LSSQFRSFFCIEQHNENINEALAHNKEKTPFIWIRGDIKNLSILQAFVVIEHLAVPVENSSNAFLHALNICYKMHHVLQLQFASEVEATWKFVEYGIFGRKFEGAKVSHTVKALIGQIMPKVMKQVYPDKN